MEYLWRNREIISGIPDNHAEYESMPIDNAAELVNAAESTSAAELTITNSRMHMTYRAYTLHPNVDDYFYYNYPHYKTMPLIQNAYYLLDCTKKDLRGFSISVPIHVQGNICTDIFIKLGQLHATCIDRINVQISGFRTDHGIYNLDWITIYMYNLRQHPDLVARNIFILPNLVLIASTMYNYILDIKFNHVALYEYVFQPWRSAVWANMLPDIGGQVMKYVPNHVLIDIWGRTDRCDQSAMHITHSQIFSMLKSSFKLVYMSNYLLNCNSESAITINIHKNVMHNHLLFSYICKDHCGQWRPISQFAKLVIRIGGVEHTILEHELTILPYLYNIHYIKQVKPLREYTIPSKFKLTSNITDSGETHPYMYLIHLSEYIDHSLIMGDGGDDEDAIMSLTFYREITNPDQTIDKFDQTQDIQLYVELSTK